LNVTQLSACLPDGFVVEISVAALQWWRDAARCLDRGWLLTLDYGLMIEEMFSPSRVQGTLRAYRQHRIAQDVLADPGGQDITAHVDFAALAHQERIAQFHGCPPIRSHLECGSPRGAGMHLVDDSHSADVADS
jgi:SAM-dependent MidA family methyltransferase